MSSILAEMNDLYAALEKVPTDEVLLLALADLYLKRGSHAAAECLQWVVIEGKTPYRYFHSTDGLRHHHDSWHDGWYWWTTSRERRGWGYPKSCVVPQRIWSRMTHTLPYDPLVFKEYPTIRAALEALIQGWQTPRRRSPRSVPQ